MPLLSTEASFGLGQSTTHIGVHKLVDGGENILMTGDIFQCVRAIFLYPDALLSLCRLGLCLLYQGRESSASTGRLAALLLPFELVLFELKTMES